jgi:putative ABC transport system permease protein
MSSPRKPIFTDTTKDVHDELAAHLEMRREDLVAGGMPDDRARELAERRFGNMPAIARECRDIDERQLRQGRRARMWTDLRQDISYAFRLLRRSPGFTAVAIVTLALGIGATTTIFSLANWTLLRPIAGVNRPDDLQQIWVGTRSERGFSPSRVSYPNLFDLRPRLRTVDLAGTQNAGALSIAVDREAARPVPGEFVSSNYFALLGVRFAVGRPFSEEDDRPGAPANVVIVSRPFAVSLFGEPAAALGRELLINGVPFTIVGIPGEDFEGTHRVRRSSVWLPGSTYPRVNHMPTLSYERRADGGFYQLLGRPLDGHTVAQIDAELQGTAAWLAAEFPKENSKFSRVRFHMMGSLGIDPLARERTAASVLLMLGLSGLVLLIACSNVASLLLMRGLGRQGEMAVRTALGAGRIRVIRQHLTEGTLLWLLGGSAALGFVWLVLQVVSGAALLGLRGELGPVPLDWRVATFALVLSLVVGLAFTLVPALRTSQVDPGSTLKRGSGWAAPRHPRIGTALSALQVALSLTLVVGALLLAGTVRNLSRVDLGFDPSYVQTFSVNSGSVGYSASRSAEYREESARRLRLLPGVAAVASAANLPFFGAYFTRLRAVGTDTFHETLAMQLATPELFDVLRIPLVAGRTYTFEDFGTAGSAPRDRVVLGAATARLLFGSTDVVGRTIEYGTINEKGRIFEVIGVVGDVRTGDATQPAEPVVYEAPDADLLRRSVTFAVRVRPGTEIAADVRAIAASLDHALPIGTMMSMEEHIAGAHAEWTTLATLMTVLSAIAAVLAAVGLYGVIAFGVAARRREFGIRLALGAAPSRVSALVLRRTAMITSAGIVLGLAGASVLSRAIESRLFGVARFDPVTWSLAALLLVVIAFAASWIPARRAARVEVTTALRAL